MKEEIIGSARVIYDECRDVLPGLSGVDAVVTDPPYNVGMATAVRMTGEMDYLDLGAGMAPRIALPRPPLSRCICGVGNFTDWPAPRLDSVLAQA